MKVSREARAQYAQQIAREIEEAVKDPGNFTKNKYAEDAIAQVTIGGNKNGSSEPS
ncbi:MAG: hypothetical protein NC548_06340 [Lachnospiraceae bacterium]|nr:hypothetical protein [Lachnospiraceae bacterium]